MDVTCFDELVSTTDEGVADEGFADVNCLKISLPLSE
jgi:hypothetical protein